MRHVLHPHPDTPCAAVSAIEVDVSRGAEGRMNLHYHTSGLPVFPDPTLESLSETMRADELWLHTCFEVFVRPAGGEAYVEFNFSPALQWAAYRLDGYRRNRRNFETAPPVIRTLTGDGLTLDAAIQLAEFAARDWQVGLSAVIEGDTGAISYWALKHAPGKPDFHHADAFALELPVTP